MAANIVPQKVEDVDTQALSPMMQQYLEIKRQHPNAKPAACRTVRQCAACRSIRMKFTPPA